MFKFFSLFIENNKLKHAFTLAEVLITLAIVGVVAVLVIPSITASVQTKTRARQVETSKAKFNKAVQLMALNNEIGPYYTDGVDFVQNLGKYLKINQICRVGSEPNSLPPVSSCFGEDYNYIKTTDGEDIDIKMLFSGGKAFGIKDSDDTNDWSTPSVAFYTIDGTRYIIAYNTKCPEVAAGVYEGNAAAGCVAGVVDVDGAKKPNTLGYDVYLMGSAKNLAESVCYGKGLGFCYNAPVNLVSIYASKGFVTQSECLANASKWGIPTSYCTQVLSSYADDNWFATAVKECGNISNMMPQTDIDAMMTYVYTNLTNYDNTKTYGSLTFDTEKAAQFGIPDLNSTGGSFQVIAPELEANGTSSWKVYQYSLWSYRITRGYSISALSTMATSTTTYIYCKAN